MSVKRTLAWAGVVAMLCLATPVAAMLGAALWQTYAPGSLRSVVLTASALAEPGEVEAAIERIEVALDAGFSGSG